VLDLVRFEQEAESFLQAFAHEEYAYESGQKPSLDLAPIYDRFRTLFTAEQFRALRDEPIEPARKRMLLDFVATQILLAAARPLTEQIALREAARRLTWRGEQLPYRLLPIRIMNERDTQRRHELERLRWEVLEELNPLYGDRLRRLQDAARELDYPDAAALFDELRALHVDDLARALGVLLRDTDDAYREGLDRALASLGLRAGQAWACDIRPLQRMAEFDLDFPRAELLASAQRTMAALGLRIEEQTNIILDTVERPTKSPRAFCSPVQVPHEVYLVLQPAGGVYDYHALFHELGHAEHYANIDPALPMPYRWLGDNSVTESYAFLFQNLLLDERWLRWRLDVGDLRAYLERAWLLELYLLRRYTVKLHYELALYRAERLDEMSTLYHDEFTCWLGVEYPAAAYLQDVDDGLYVAAYLRAWILSAQLQAYLRREFEEEWFRSPRAGKFLVELWREGQRYSAEELARFLGYEGLDLRPLVAALNDGLGLSAPAPASPSPGARAGQ